MKTQTFCKHRENFKAKNTAEEALRDEPVRDWELFECCCCEQADRRIRDKRSEILKIVDPEALRTLSHHDLTEQSRLYSPLDVKTQIARVYLVIFDRALTKTERMMCAHGFRCRRKKK